MVVVPAVAAAVAAPLLALCSARLERRRVLVGLSALVVASDVIAGLAPGIGVMLAARAVLGMCVGGFWVFGAGAAITLVGEQARGTAEEAWPCSSPRCKARWPPGHSPCWAGPARPSALRRQARQIWPARGAGILLAGLGRTSTPS